jgi:hypothetical protein
MQLCTYLLESRLEQQVTWYMMSINVSSTDMSTYVRPPDHQLLYRDIFPGHPNPGPPSSYSFRKSSFLLHRILLLLHHRLLLLLLDDHNIFLILIHSIRSSWHIKRSANSIIRSWCIQEPSVCSNPPSVVHHQ